MSCRGSGGLVVGLSPRRLGIHQMSVRVVRVAKKSALEQVSVRLLRFSRVSIIPPLIHTRSLIYHRRLVLIAIDSVLNWRTLEHTRREDATTFLLTWHYKNANSQYHVPTVSILQRKLQGKWEPKPILMLGKGKHICQRQTAKPLSSSNINVILTTPSV